MFETAIFKEMPVKKKRVRKIQQPFSSYHKKACNQEKQSGCELATKLESGEKLESLSENDVKNIEEEIRAVSFPEIS